MELVGRKADFAFMAEIQNGGRRYRGCRITIVMGGLDLIFDRHGLNPPKIQVGMGVNYFKPSHQGNDFCEKYT